MSKDGTFVNVTITGNQGGDAGHGGNGTGARGGNSVGTGGKGGTGWAGDGGNGGPGGGIVASGTLRHATITANSVGAQERPARPRPAPAATAACPAPEGNTITGFAGSAGSIGAVLGFSTTTPANSVILDNATPSCVVAASGIVDGGYNFAVPSPTPRARGRWRTPTSVDWPTTAGRP